MNPSPPTPQGNKSWEKFLQSTIEYYKDDDPNIHFAQLATVHRTMTKEPNVQDRPSCRTIRIRHVKDRRLTFITDNRSAKYFDLTGASPYGELCWYFPTGRLQFRLSGQVYFLDDQEKLDKVWKSLSDDEKLWWTWPTPGDMRESDTIFENIAKKQRPETAPESFAVAQLIPDYVDILCNRKPPFWREQHERSQDGAWRVHVVNP